MTQKYVKLQDAHGKPVVEILGPTDKLGEAAIIVYNDEYYAYNWTSNSFRLCEPPLKIEGPEYTVCD